MSGPGPSVTFWHATRRGGGPSGIRRYEGAVSRLGRPIHRPDGLLRGSTFVSWAFDYRCHSAEVVHATSGMAGAPALLRRPDPFVVTSHGPIPVRYPTLVEDLTTALQWNVMPRVLEAADRIIANSAFTRRELIDVYGLDPADITVVHLGVDTERFRPRDGLACESPVVLLDPPRPTVLILSSNLPQKRMDIAEAVIDALADDVQFVKAGYGAGLGRPDVVDVGWVSDRELIDLYNAADVLFHPSEYESFGLPLLEAMACGTPVVAQDRTAIPEVVGAEGGVLVERPSIQRFADAIEDAIDGSGLDPRARAETFTWERTVARTREVHEAVAS